MRAKYIKVNRDKQQSPKTQKGKTKQTNKQKTKNKHKKIKKKYLKKHLTDKPYKRAETLKKHKTIDYN